MILVALLIVQGFLIYYHSEIIDWIRSFGYEIKIEKDVE